MKKVVVASLLALASVVAVARTSFAQTQPSLGTGPAGGQVQMTADEYKVYNNAVTQTTPAAKAAAFEDYLKAYPQSAVKGDVLQQLMVLYSTLDPTKSLDAADRLLQVEPDNLRAMLIEVYFRKTAADADTDATKKQSDYDAAAGFAQKGLATTKPSPGMTDAQFKAVQSQATPTFYGAIATAAANKKDSATAIDNYKKELSSVPVAQTQAPGPMLQDTYALGIAYLQSTPPDYVKCAFYVARAANFAPEPYKTQMLPTSKYCYKKFHGADDGYDAVTTAAAANLDPPADFSIKPAPSAADIAAGVIASTPDLGTLAVSDKEFIMQNGKPEDAEKVWATIKGKTSEFPDATVIAATDSSLQVAVSDDAVQTKTADFTFTMKEPLKTVPEVGAKVALDGTYASYTPSPLMITMSDASVVEPKKAPVKKAVPAHRPVHK